MRVAVRPCIRRKKVIDSATGELMNQLLLERICLAGIAPALPLLFRLSFDDLLNPDNPNLPRVLPLNLNLLAETYSLLISFF